MSYLRKLLFASAISVFSLVSPPVFAGSTSPAISIDAGEVIDLDLVAVSGVRSARALHIPIESTAVSLTVENPKALLKQLNAMHLADLDCLKQTMDRLDEGMDPMVLRANAWADGDIEQLRTMSYIDQKEACIGALANSVIARQQGLTNLSERVRNNWLAAVTDAFAQHHTVFATMPTVQLLDPAGVIAILRDEGFQVKTPD